MKSQAPTFTATEQAVLKKLFGAVDVSHAQPGWHIEPCNTDGIEIVDQVFQDLVGDLQSMAITELRPCDQAMTFPTRRTAALRLV